MKVKRQITIGVAYTWWDDGTIEVDAYQLESGRRSFPLGHLEDRFLDPTEVSMLEATVSDQIHMIGKRALKRTDLLLF